MLKLTRYQNLFKVMCIIAGAIHGQASVNVKKVGTEYCAQDLAPFTPLAKAAGVFAPAKTTHSAYLTMEHAFVLQVKHLHKN